MKRITPFILALCLIASCSEKKETKTIAELTDEINNFQIELFQDSSLTNEQKTDQYYQYLGEVYEKHYNDTLDIQIFTNLMISVWSPDETEAKYEVAPKAIKNDSLLVQRYTIIMNQKNVASGKDYIDIPGIDPITGEEVSLSQIIKSDKPTLLDFWASWCGPCKNEIANNLKPLAESGEINIIGIAVWEDSIDDTKAAMEEFGITWPVIYNGGRENSISEEYGVLGIPTLFLVGTDGKIIEGGHHSIETMDFFKK